VYLVKGIVAGFACQGANQICSLCEGANEEQFPLACFRKDFAKEILEIFVGIGTRWIHRAIGLGK